MPEALAFPAHILWSIALFAMMGLTIGNLNALAMEPLGHVAGLAASVISSIATVLSVLLAVPVGLAFDDTNLPLLTGTAVFIAASLGLMRLMPTRGDSARLFGKIPGDGEGALDPLGLALHLTLQHDLGPLHLRSPALRLQEFHQPAGLANLSLWNCTVAPFGPRPDG